MVPQPNKQHTVELLLKGVQVHQKGKVLSSPNNSKKECLLSPNISIPGAVSRHFLLA